MLFEAKGGRLRPLYWAKGTTDAFRAYRLPSVAYVPSSLDDESVFMTEVFEQILQQRDRPANASAPPLLRSFKPYINSGLPFQSTQTQQWEPHLRQSETQTIPLIDLQHLLTQLLTLITPSDRPWLHCGAEGLTPDEVRDRLTNLEGVILNHPSGSSDTYRFTLRETVLAAGLVSQPDRIFFVDEVVAALIAGCVAPQLATGAPLTTAAIAGPCLVLSAGASTTEVLVISTAKPLAQLTPRELYIRRIAYAGNSLDQDIICHLLYPIARGWESLDFASLNLPLPGEPDLEARYRLQQRLESVPLGQRLLNSVRKIKPILCQQDVSFGAEGRQWTIRQEDLQNWIIAPYLQQLNREINGLLPQLGLKSEEIQQVICAGETTLIPAIAVWLREKFPHARFVAQDGTANNFGPSVAAGLAVLPSFSALLDANRHQFGDYFLLQTLLRQLQAEAKTRFSLSELQNHLVESGVPLAVGRTFLANLLEGRLPSGLAITPTSAVLFAETSVQCPDYRLLGAAPLFKALSNDRYELNPQQCDRLWAHLQNILAHTHQTLQAPLSPGALAPTAPQR